MKVVVLIYSQDAEVSAQELLAQMYVEAQRISEEIPGKGAVAVRVELVDGPSGASLYDLVMSATKGIQESIERAMRGDMSVKFSVQEIKDEKGH